MKRTTAREIAVQLGFYAAQTGKSVADIAEEFFDKDYYSTLAEVDELYAEYPEKKQMDYIIRLASLVEDYRVQMNVSYSAQTPKPTRPQPISLLCWGISFLISS